MPGRAPVRLSSTLQGAPPRPACRDTRISRTAREIGGDEDRHRRGEIRPSSAPDGRRSAPAAACRARLASIRRRSASPGRSTSQQPDQRDRRRRSRRSPNAARRDSRPARSRSPPATSRRTLPAISSAPSRRSSRSGVPAGKYSRPALAVCAPISPSTKAPSRLRSAPMPKTLNTLGSGKPQSRQARKSAKPVSKQSARKQPSANEALRPSSTRPFHSAGFSACFCGEMRRDLVAPLLGEGPAKRPTRQVEPVDPMDGDVGHRLSRRPRQIRLLGIEGKFKRPSSR